MAAVLAIATAGCGGENAPATITAQPVVLGTAPAHPDPHARTTMVESAGKNGTRLVVVDLSTGRRRVIARSSAVRGGDVGLAGPAFSPSGDYVAAASATQSADGRRMTEVIVAPVDGRRAARRVPGVRLVNVDSYRPVWTPDGRAIAVPHADGDGIDLTDVRSGRRHTLVSHAGDGVAFAPDGKTNPKRVTTTTPDESGPLRWTLDGNTIVFSVFAGGRLTVRVLDVTHRCTAALTLAAAARPPSGELEDWDMRAACGGRASTTAVAGATAEPSKTVAATSVRYRLLHAPVALVEETSSGPAFQVRSE